MSWSPSFSSFNKQNTQIFNSIKYQSCLLHKKIKQNSYSLRREDFTNSITTTNLHNSEFLKKEPKHSIGLSIPKIGMGNREESQKAYWFCPRMGSRERGLTHCMARRSRPHRLSKSNTGGNPSWPISQRLILWCRRGTADHLRDHARSVFIAQLSIFNSKIGMKELKSSTWSWGNYFIIMQKWLLGMGVYMGLQGQKGIHRRRQYLEPGSRRVRTPLIGHQPS